MIFGVAMRTLFFAVGLVAILVGCGRTPPATLDESVTNTARAGAGAGNSPGSAGGAGDTWRGTGGAGSATTSGTGGVLGNGGAIPPTVGTGGRPAGTGGATPPTVGTGGRPGGTGGSIGCPAAAGDAAINFCKGRAQGTMTGWGWVALGAVDTLTSPRCNGASESITGDNPCLATDGSMLWSSSDALCVSGSLPVVTGGDYTANWGIMVGWNASEPEGAVIGKTFSRATFTWQGTVVPTNTAIRGILHRRGDPSDTFYCATVQSGRSVPFEAFNTRCWDRTGVDLTARDVPSIDKMAVQISSDDRRSYAVTDFCVTGVTFEPPIMLP